jgi:hypothetical protein
MTPGIVFWGLAIALLAASFFKDRVKTLHALKKAGKALLGILPRLLGIIVLIGSITLIPGFIAFPTAALLRNGLAYLFSLLVALVMGLVLRA